MPPLHTISLDRGTHLKDGDSERMFEVGVAVQDDLAVVAIEIRARDQMQHAIHPEQPVGGIVWQKNKQVWWEWVECFRPNYQWHAIV